jgi:D-amino-acid dehydrogenase
MSDSDRGFLICPMEEGYRLTSGVEFAGLHAPKTPVQLEKILPSARELFPLGDPVEASPWVGCRPCFADARPVVGAAPRHAGLWFNFGHGYMGLTIGPASARLLAEMMKGEKPFCDPHPYRPERFAC